VIETNFIPFPVLTTDRLVLRQLEAGDDQDIFAHRADERVTTYLENFSHSSIEQTQAFISRVQQEIAEGRSILWVLTRKGNNRFMGTVCLWNIVPELAKAETGYTLDPEFHGMGYMQEALEKALDFGFNTIRLNKIEAYTHQHNEASIRLLRRNGFIQEPVPAKPVSENRAFFLLNKGS